MKPLVSILIPAFNAQEWIADTLKSAMGQTWPRKEIIVVDDGSRDQTLAIARGLGSKEVSVVTQANQGAAATRNRAYSICQGDYIQWLDADDLLEPDKIARQMDATDRDAGKRMLLSSAWGYFMYRVHRADFVPTPPGLTRTTGHAPALLLVTDEGGAPREFAEVAMVGSARSHAAS